MEPGAWRSERNVLTPCERESRSAWVDVCVVYTVQVQLQFNVAGSVSDLTSNLAFSPVSGSLVGLRPATTLAWKISYLSTPQAIMKWENVHSDKLDSGGFEGMYNATHRICIRQCKLPMSQIELSSMVKLLGL